MKISNVIQQFIVPFITAVMLGLMVSCSSGSSTPKPADQNPSTNTNNPHHVNNSLPDAAQGGKDITTLLSSDMQLALVTPCELAYEYGQASYRKGTIVRMVSKMEEQQSIWTFIKFEWDNRDAPSWVVVRGGEMNELGSSSSVGVDLHVDDHIALFDFGNGREKFGVSWPASRSFVVLQDNSLLLNMGTISEAKTWWGLVKQAADGDYSHEKAQNKCSLTYQ